MSIGRLEGSLTGALQFSEMIASSPIKTDAHLFPVLYEFLSSFVHSGSRHIRAAWKDESGFDLVNEDEDESAIVFVMILNHTIVAMIMQGLLKLGRVSFTSRRDIRFFCKIVREINRDAFGRETIKSSGKEYRSLLAALRARSNALPNLHTAEVRA